MGQSRARAYPDLIAVRKMGRISGSHSFRHDHPCGALAMLSGYQEAQIVQGVSCAIIFITGTTLSPHFFGFMYDVLRIRVYTK